MEESALIRMTIDEPSDLKLANLVWFELGGESPFFGSKEVIDLYQKKPDLFLENKSVEQIRFSLPKNESEKRKFTFNTEIRNNSVPVILIVVSPFP